MHFDFKYINKSVPKIEATPVCLYIILLLLQGGHVITPMPGATPTKPGSAVSWLLVGNNLILSCICFLVHGHIYNNSLNDKIQTSELFGILMF